MDNSLYVVLSKQTALFRQMAVVANNVANADTNGFKAQTMLYATHPIKSKSPNEINHKIDFTKDINTFTNFEEGNYKITEAPFDVALHGDGFFKVKTPLGMRYTRSGNFTLNSEGELVTAQGYQVMGADGQAITFQAEDKDILIREDGTISVRSPGQQQFDDRGTIGVVRFSNNQLLERTGESLYKSDLEPANLDPAEYRVSQGALEESNVEPVSEITEMIKLSRTVGLTGKFLSDVNELERSALRVINRQS